MTTRAAPSPASVLIAAGCARAALAGLRAAQPGGREIWDRTNHAGRTVSLLEGPAWALGALGGLLIAGGRGGTAGALAVAGAAAVGALDDHVGTTTVKGLRGHLGALRQGQVTTGVLKIVGLAATGLAAVTVLDAAEDHGPGTGTLLGGAVVAAAADLANLFDLRPGRALKVVLLTTPLAACGGAQARGLAAVTAGACCALLPEDLAGRTMLGDTGANAAGALAGLAAVAGRGHLARATTLAVLAGLILASERVSFTAVIARTPWLDAADRWGRSR
ncbi:hypothetical protein [Arsenicicoccus dermatophilus]|uniref:hypothetical protein n=1 Tax=Arsenicicoccus dermatophilus TaxID=1076331 RepID=UPI00391758BF